jgi:hypothetical protein
MAITERQLDVARIALAATGRKYGVALAGGNALNVHEQLIRDSRGIARGTQDVDLFVLRQRDVKRAVAAVIAALERAGYVVARHDKTDGLPALGFDDADYEMAQLIATHPGDGPDDPEPVQVEISHFYYASAKRSPIGPVLSLDDLAGWKTVAFGSRRAYRDPADVASFVAAGYEPARLIDLAMARDNGLEPADFAEAAVWVDDSPDEVFLPYLGERDTGDGGEMRDVAWLRRMFAKWPREPLHAG